MFTQGQAEFDSEGDFSVERFISRGGSYSFHESSPGSAEFERSGSTGGKGS